MYEGQWHLGSMHGFGTLTYSTGDLYEGNYASNAREGYGIYVYKMSGDRYEGTW